MHAEKNEQTFWYEAAMRVQTQRRSIQKSLEWNILAYRLSYGVACRNCHNGWRAVARTADGARLDGWEPPDGRATTRQPRGHLPHATPYDRRHPDIFSSSFSIPPSFRKSNRFPFKRMLLFADREEKDFGKKEVGMRILAAELIDGENISPKWAGDLHHVLHNEAQHGVEFVIRLIVGAPQALRAWGDSITTYQIQARTHAGGKNAADELLQQEALSLANQGVCRFYLATNDGGFAGTARRLCYKGCQVVGFGNAHAARRFKEACTVFSVLGSNPTKLAATLLALTWPSQDCLPGRRGGSMSQQASTESTPITLQEMFHMIYGSKSLPVSLSKVLSTLLQHTLTALCLTEQDSELVSKWSPDDDAEMFEACAHDPIIAFILGRHADLETQWQAVQAFAHRCNEAHEQGRAAARHAFPHFPRQCVTALHRQHLADLLLTWRYNPYDAPPKTQQAYPGYTPEAEHTTLLRWFRRGYLCGAVEAPH